MDELTLERYVDDPKLRAELDRAARRERARYIKRFLEQSAAALLGRATRESGAKLACPEPCA